MNNTDQFFDKKVIGHPAALFVLFFTEMWERFSYYGMRAILVIFLTGAILGENPGWGWTSSSALSLLGTYAMFVYLTPLLGGLFLQISRSPLSWNARVNFTKSEATGLKLFLALKNLLN